MEETVDGDGAIFRPAITCVERTRKLSILLRRHKEPVNQIQIHSETV